MVAPTTRLRLRVARRASAPVVVGRHGDFWDLRVTAAPERGRIKIVELTGIEPDEIERRLAMAGGQETETG